MKKSIETLLTQLRIADVVTHGDTTVIHVESMDSADTLAITISIPTSEVDNYDLSY